MRRADCQLNGVIYIIDSQTDILVGLHIRHFVFQLRVGDERQHHNFAQKNGVGRHQYSNHAAATDERIGNGKRNTLIANTRKVYRIARMTGQLEIPVLVRCRAISVPDIDADIRNRLQISGIENASADDCGGRLQWILPFGNDRPKQNSGRKRNYFYNFRHNFANQLTNKCVFAIFKRFFKAV